MKMILRSLLVALTLATAGFFTQSAIAAVPSPSATETIAKAKDKSGKKAHKKHKKKTAKKKAKKAHPKGKKGTV